MVLSLAVIVGVVGVVLLFAPQPGPVEQPQVSAPEAVAAVEAGSVALGAPLLLLVAGDAAGLGVADVPAAADVLALPQGWRLDYARTEAVDDLTTWRVGVLTPDERRIELEQAVEPSEQWLTRSDTGSVEPPEPVELGGLTWVRQVRGDGDTAYTYAGPAAAGSAADGTAADGTAADGAAAEGGGLTTAVSATSDTDDLRAVVEQVAGALQG